MTLQDHFFRIFCGCSRRSDSWPKRPWCHELGGEESDGGGGDAEHLQHPHDQCHGDTQEGVQSSLFAAANVYNF